VIFIPAWQILPKISGESQVGLLGPYEASRTANFAFETTLANIRHAVRLKRLKEQDYQFHLVFRVLPASVRDLTL